MRARRVLGVWIALACLGGVAAAVSEQDDGTQVDAAGESPATVPSRPKVVAAPTTTTTSVPTTTTVGTIASTTAPAPVAPSVHIEQPGLWIIRRDGGEARYLGNDQGAYVGHGASRTGYDLAWGPDSQSMYFLSDYDDVGGRLTRMELSDGSLTRYDLPESPPIGGDIGPAPRRMTGFARVGTHLTFSWLRADGFAGASIATFDLRDIVELEGYCCDGTPSPRGDQVAFSPREGVLDIVDLDGRLVRSIGPREATESRGNSAWSPDGTRMVMGSCVVELRTGACIGRVDSGGRELAGWTRDGTQLLWWQLAPNAAPDAVSVGPPAGPVRTIADGFYPIADPLADRVIVAQNPYQEGLPGAASLHAVSLDGSVDHVMATTRNAVAVPWGWSPDGQWIAVHLGGPRG